MDKQFKRILELVRRTGDRMIVTDSDGENVYVVMDIDAYEGLIDMEDHVLDGMMMDESQESFEVPVREESVAESLIAAEDSRIWDHIPEAGSQAETWDLDKLTDAERLDLEQQFAEYSNKVKEVAEVPELSVAEEILGQGPSFAKASEDLRPVEDTGTAVNLLSDDDDFNEEQFYLEPIE